MKIVRALVAAGVAVLLAVAAVWLLRDTGDGSADPATAAPDRSAPATPPATPRATATSGASPATSGASPATSGASPATTAGACDTDTGGVRPRRIAVPGLTDRVRVVAPPRDANGVPGVPPLTEAGKRVFAWDREQGVEPGDAAGNVLLNAHTWPDGSALGNTLLDGLHRGDRIVVRGEGRRLCYRVTERVEVLAEDGLPRYYDADGPPRLAIVVCSGRRLAPGVWEKRTVWFASPVHPR